MRADDWRALAAAQRGAVAAGSPAAAVSWGALERHVVQRVKQMLEALPEVGGVLVIQGRYRRVLGCHRCCGIGDAVRGLNKIVVGLCRTSWYDILVRRCHSAQRCKVSQGRIGKLAMIDPQRLAIGK